MAASKVCENEEEARIFYSPMRVRASGLSLVLAKNLKGAEIMKRRSNFIMRPTGSMVLFAMLLAEPQSVLAHCDGMDGPVVKAAQ